MRYVTGFCNQTKILKVLSDSGVWVMSFEFELWVLSYENWVMSKPNKPLLSLFLTLSRFLTLSLALSQCLGATPQHRRCARTHRLIREPLTSVSSSTHKPTPTIMPPLASTSPPLSLHHSLHQNLKPKVS